jgi:hypothetical protein
MKDKLLRRISASGRQLAVMVDAECPQCAGTGVIVVGDRVKHEDGVIKCWAHPDICPCLHPAPIDPQIEHPIG